MNRLQSFEQSKPIENHKTKIWKNSKFPKELSLLFIVGIIGCFGTFSIFNIGWNKDVKIQEQSLETINIPQKISNTSPNRIHNPSVEVSGSFIVGKPLKFNIPNYNPEAEYEVDFGDGLVKIINTEIFEYTYLSSGNFELIISINFKDENSHLYSTIIRINNQNEEYITSL